MAGAAGVETAGGPKEKGADAAAAAGGATERKGEETIGGLGAEGAPNENGFAIGAGEGRADGVAKLKAAGAGTALGVIEAEVLLKGVEGFPKLKAEGGALASAVLAAGAINEIGVTASATFGVAGVGGAPKLNPVVASAAFGTEATGAAPKPKGAFGVEVVTVCDRAVAFAGIENKGAASDTFVGVTEGATGALKEKEVAVVEGAAGLRSTDDSAAAGFAKSKAAAGFAKLKAGVAAFGDTSFDPDPDPNERGEGVIVLLEENEIGAILTGSAETLLVAIAGIATTGLAKSDGSSLIVADVSVACRKIG